MSKADEISNLGYDIFISYYSKTGKDFARYLKNGLKDFEINAFLDEEDIPKTITKETDEWRSCIDNAIKNSENFVLVMTLGFNERNEVLRELKVAFEHNIKRYFLKHENLNDHDLSVKIDGRIIDLSQYEYIPFSNEPDLLRKVVASLLGKLGQEKESLFRSEANRIMATEGVDIKKTKKPIVEVVVGTSNDIKEWFLPTSQNKLLLYCSPYRCQRIIPRRKFFECESRLSEFFRVHTNGFFHVVSLLIHDERRDLYYVDSIIRQILEILLYSIKMMKFHHLESEQSILIMLRNVANVTVTFDERPWHAKHSFSNTPSEIEFRRNFNPKDDWKGIGNVFVEIYRELCTEVGCLEISDSIIKKRLYEILKYMPEIQECSINDIRIPRIDIETFGFV